jgi:excisionase family DNA binding protein
MDSKKPDLLTPEEAADELRITVRTLYQMMSDGRLVAKRIRGMDKVLIRREDVNLVLVDWAPREKGFAAKKAGGDADAEAGE